MKEEKKGKAESSEPLVSVICLCYNHEDYVSEAIQSVMDQTYPSIELIVVDDASSDNSQEVIRKFIGEKDIQFIPLSDNSGNTKAFNHGFRTSRGDFIIDLAADDVLLPNRIELQVSLFQNSPGNVGVIYSDAVFIDSKGKPGKRHFASKNFESYEGDVYEKLIDTYFIPPPTMMMKRKVLEELNGYDEKLAYEDFDFWIRSSRNWQYRFVPEITTQIRRVDGSLSTRAYDKNGAQLLSTFEVCEKIKGLNQSPAEDAALNRRLKYEIKHATLSGNFKEARLFIDLLKSEESLPFFILLLSWLARLKIDFSPLRRFYLKLSS